MVEDVDGNRYLDFMAGIAVTSTGYNHPRGRRGGAGAAGRFLHICGTDFYYDGMSPLCERLAQLAPGPEPQARVPHQLGHRGRRGRDQAGAPLDRPHGVHRVHGRVSRADLRRAVAHRQQGGPARRLRTVPARRVPRSLSLPVPLRFCRGEPRAPGGACAHIEEDLFGRHLAPRTWPRSSSSRSRAKAATSCRRDGLPAGPPRAVRPARHPPGVRRGAVGRSGAPARCGPASTRASSPTCSRSPRAWARGCRSARSSRRSRS